MSSKVEVDFSIVRRLLQYALYSSESLPEYNNPNLYSDEDWRRYFNDNIQPVLAAMTDAQREQLYIALRYAISFYNNRQLSSITTDHDEYVIMDMQPQKYYMRLWETLFNEPFKRINKTEKGKFRIKVHK